MPYANPVSIFWDPVGFVRAATPAKPRIALAAGIVGACLLIWMIGLALLGHRIVNSIPSAFLVSEDARKTVLFGNSVTVLIWGVAGLLLWIIGSGILCCLCILLDGDADFRKVLELGGYAHLPLLLFSVCLFLFAFFYRPSLDLPLRTDISEQEKVQEIGVAMDKEVRSVSFRLIASFLGCCLLWHYVLWTIALKECGKLSFGKSVACTAGLALLLLLVVVLRRQLNMGGP
ncbi:MAG: YIP1 family protein [Planctomycetes bacterium]|nr:YIP1 family protein [Planctomycetota bacterium]